MRRFGITVLVAVAAVLLLALPAGAKGEPKVGATVKVGSGTVTVHAYEQPYVAPDDGGGTFTPQAGEELASLDVEACNKSKGVVQVDPFQFRLEMPDHTRAAYSFVSRDPALEATPLGKGDCVRGWVMFQPKVGQRPKFAIFVSQGGASGKVRIVKWRVPSGVPASG